MAGQELMAGMSHAAQIDLCLGDVGRASSWISALAPVPAISPASASTSSHKAGSEQTGEAQSVAKRFFSRRANAALGGARAGADALIRAVGLDLPNAQTGRAVFPHPAFTKTLSSEWRWKVARQRCLFSVCWRGLDYFELSVLDLLHVLSQCCAEDCPTPLDLAQAGVAAAFGYGRQAVDPLDVVEFLGEGVGHEVVHAPGRADKNLMD
jgi:hypothetical protein